MDAELSADDRGTRMTFGFFGFRFDWLAVTNVVQRCIPACCSSEALALNHSLAVEVRAIQKSREGCTTG